MKAPSSKLAGFTIIETLLFVVATSVLFALTVTYLDGRNEEVQFRDSVTHLELIVSQTIERVRTGDVIDGADCLSVYGAGPLASSGACLKLGEVITFADITDIGSDKSAFEIHEIYGARLTPDQLSSPLCASRIHCSNPYIHAEPVDSGQLRWAVEFTGAQNGNELTPTEFGVANLGFVRDPQTGTVVAFAANKTDDIETIDLFIENVFNLQLNQTSGGGVRASSVGDELSGLYCISRQDGRNFGGLFIDQNLSPRFTYQEARCA